MKNGFTLIELLAVIVILAIIALIAVPIVLNIINDSKESSGLRSAEFYLDAVEYTIADAFLYHGGLEDKEYPITPDGNICKKALPCDDANILKVEVNGDKPTGGSITINGGNISSVELVLDEKTIIKNSKGELVYLKYLDEVCELVSGTAKTASAKYECKVDPNKEAYTFYVLTTPSATDTNINLIMDRNINSDGSPTTKVITEANKNNNGGVYNIVPWITKENYLTLGGTEDNWNNWVDNNKFGPITAMNFLSKATKNWTNTNELIVDTFIDDTGKSHNMKTYNTYARMPYRSEVNDSSKIWLINCLHGLDDEMVGIVGIECSISNIYGYWTASNDQFYFKNAWCVYMYGGVKSQYVEDYSEIGVRPVINLKI